MLRNFKPRLYQETIFATAMNYNTLVVLPTGMGKTSVALMMAAHRLKQYPDSKILVLAPTKPLVEQLMQVFRKHLELPEDQIIMFTGLIKAEKRHQMFKDAKIICTTPQGLENDLIGNKIDLSNISLLVLDEAHRAVGDYSYVFVACSLQSMNPDTNSLNVTKWWTIKQIEDNLNTGIFSEMFLLEYNFIKRSGLITSGFCTEDCTLKKDVGSLNYRKSVS